MNFWRNCDLQDPDEAALHTSYIQPVMLESDAPHPDGKDQPSGTWLNWRAWKHDLVYEESIFSTENRKTKNDNMVGETLQQNESCSSFQNQSYVEKMEEFQFYVEMVKRFTRPGCSTESLDVALSSLSSLVDTLSAISSQHHHFIRPSL